MLHRLGAGLVASGLVAVLVKFVGLQPGLLSKAQILAWQDLPLFVLPTEPDRAAESIMRQFLQDWSDKGASAKNQGVWMQSGLTRLAKHQGTIPRPAASLTKIATTLAALEQWGPTHRFETLVSGTGPIKNGVLQGDLVITGKGNPFFVWEEAIALGNRLNQLGIRRVTGNLVIIGNFYMNYQENPVTSGQLFRQGLDSSQWSKEIHTHHGLMLPGTPKPKVTIAGEVKVATTPISGKALLLRHRSISLAQILREMNIYSNNEMAEMFGKAVGGGEAIAQLAAKATGVPQKEIQLINGSGLGVENRISPRAATAMLMAIERFLQPHNLSVTDLFPVAGRDNKGTMLWREIPEGTPVKTGTLRQVSALAGVLPTRDHGQVWFAIINGGDNIWEFRRQQDKLLQRLSQEWGTQPSVNATATQPPERLGDPKRIETISRVRAQR